MTTRAQRTWLATGFVFAAMAATVTAAEAQKKYGPGASDTEIKLGQTMPYSGPASAYGTIGKAEAAYFQMINDHAHGVPGQTRRVGESSDRRLVRAELPSHAIQDAVSSAFA